MWREYFLCLQFHFGLTEGRPKFFCLICRSIIDFQCFLRLFMIIFWDKCMNFCMSFFGLFSSYFFSLIKLACFLFIKYLVMQCLICIASQLIFYRFNIFFCPQFHFRLNEGELKFFCLSFRLVIDSQCLLRLFLIIIREKSITFSKLFFSSNQKVIKSYAKTVKFIDKTVKTKGACHQPKKISEI